MELRRSRLARIAEDLAARPIVGDENKCGPDLLPVLSYFPRENVNIGFDWCAAFVFHCCRLAGLCLPIKFPHPSVARRFAGVNAWLQWSQLPDTGFFHPGDDLGFVPVRGDLVVFDDIVGNGPHDHIGVVLRKRGDTLITAEGNIDNRSGIFRRHRRQNINGFIRIPESYRYDGPLDA